MIHQPHLHTPVHFITGAAHKFNGPKGTGILYINENVHIKPYINGGSQERNMRAGTENIYGIVGFAKALELATANYEKDSALCTGTKKILWRNSCLNIYPAFRLTAMHLAGAYTRY